MQEQLNKMHSCQLLLAAEVKRLCEKHNIKYFMIAGTLLGAVRHNGFIPWDDDMDFGMLREDYENFLTVAEKELGEQFYIKSLCKTAGFAHPFAKLYLKNTVLVEENVANVGEKDGLYIDIFPMDALPDDEKLKAAQNCKLYFLKRLLLAKLRYNPCKKGEVLKKAVYTGLRFLSFFVSEDVLKRRLNAEATKYSSSKTELIGATGGAYGYFKEAVCSEWFEKTVLLPFENLSLAAPKGYISYLERFYGDYMTPPPEDKRYNRHSVVELDLGPYIKEEE